MPEVDDDDDDVESSAGRTAADSATTAVNHVATTCRIAASVAFAIQSKSPSIECLLRRSGGLTSVPDRQRTTCVDV